MISLWNEQEATKYTSDPVALRAYSSRILGQESDLVLHGGGNTSVKNREKDFFGDEYDVLHVKGSGWDLASIEPQGFAPVKLKALLRLAEFKELSDSDMVRVQKSAMLNPNAPNPSVEAILHALIPFKFVDHTHADAVVAISNTEGGEEKIKAIYGDRILLIPYVMPGFILARKVFELTRDVDWSKIDGMILLNHGVFSFADDAKSSYERMIQMVSMAEDYLKQKRAWDVLSTAEGKSNLLQIAELRKAVSQYFGAPMVAKLDHTPPAVGFSALKNVKSIASRGPVTPDHSIHAKRIPLVLQTQVSQDVDAYAKEYQAYFERNRQNGQQCLDLAPRWAVLPNQGVVSFGPNAKRAQVVYDISQHTYKCIQWAEALGGWKALTEAEIFEAEYWELEQAKLKKKTEKPSLEGKVALVTGAASGIGKACVESLKSHGAAVVAIDIQESILSFSNGSNVMGIQCDVTDSTQIRKALKQLIESYGGLDILVSNAGMFPKGKPIELVEDAEWDKSLALNLTSHQRVLKECIPFLKLGIDPTVIIVASKNVPAPGPGASAYSVAKAGLTQLARVAALELGASGIRVNVLHPNAVFDTAIWTDEVLANRAKSYGLSVQEYKTNNLLKTEVTSKDVAELTCAMAGSLFSKSTGNQIAIDGGNERVI